MREVWVVGATSNRFGKMAETAREAATARLDGRDPSVRTRAAATFSIRSWRTASASPNIRRMSAR